MTGWFRSGCTCLERLPGYVYRLKVVTDARIQYTLQNGWIKVCRMLAVVVVLWGVRLTGGKEDYRSFVTMK